MRRDQGWGITRPGRAAPQNVPQIAARRGEMVQIARAGRANGGHGGGYRVGPRRFDVWLVRDVSIHPRPPIPTSAPRYVVCQWSVNRMSTETGKPGKLKWSWKRQGTSKLGKKKSWNFGIKYGFLPWYLFFYFSKKKNCEY